MKDKNNTIARLEKSDIQGIILRSYGSRSFARFYFLEIKDRKKARKWIGNIIPEITHGHYKTEEERNQDKGEPYLNIAFSKRGLKKLGVKTEKDTHNQSFTLGPLNSHTTRMLGDTGDNAPKHWDWGRKKDQKKIHILLMVYAGSQKGLDDYSDKLKSTFEEAKIEIEKQFETHLNKDGKEHFGYVDGISQPTIEGNTGDRPEIPENIVKAGEFVLGYENQYSRYAESPKVLEENDSKDMLRKTPDPDYANERLKDLGMNGSYIVFRQLSEDVKGFWDYVNNHIKENPYGPGAKGAEYIGAKMFGRWTNGSPITLHPEKPKDGVDKDNDFLYHKQDREGLKCPIGAHARRANPRDDFEQNPAKTDEENRDASIEFSKKHRIIRRARPYGKPLVDSMKVEDILKTTDDGEKRGIYFIVVNADYGRQFEFVQQTWMASPEFRELFSDPDPLMASQANEEVGTESVFTIQGSPNRQRMRNLKSFVHTKGSAYFFMPGIHVLKYIAEGY